MQIMPSSGGWTNAASASQQSHNDLKANSSPNRAGSVKNAIRVDQSEKSGDRDANERYEGPQGETKSKAATEISSNDNSSDLLSLPAIEDTPPSTLDLLG